MVYTYNITKHNPTEPYGTTNIIHYDTYYYTYIASDKEESPDSKYLIRSSHCFVLNFIL